MEATAKEVTFEHLCHATCTILERLEQLLIELFLFVLYVVVQVLVQIAHVLFE